MHTEKGDKTLKTFRKWNNKTIEDWGCYMSDEAKSFYRAFKNYLKRAFPDAEFTGFKPNHYDTSGFIIQDGKCIYISHSLSRQGLPIRFNDSSCMGGVLYRTAKSTTDYTGGTNHFSSIDDLKTSIKTMFENYEKIAA